MKTSRYIIAFVIALAVAISAPLTSGAQTQPLCTPDIMNTFDVFNCAGALEELPQLPLGPPNTYNNYRKYFPQRWDQLSYDQRHNPVFAVPPDAPAFLQKGRFWVAPLTGLEFLRLMQASKYYDPQSFGSTVAQYLGNVMGVSVAQGIVYVQLSRHEIVALDAETGTPIWRKDLVNGGGMGQTIVEELLNPDGSKRLVVFVPTGDAGFTLQNAVDFSLGKPHFRGANFSSLYALDGLTGEELWRFDLRGSARPAPVYKDGKLYVAGGDYYFYVLDAITGAQVAKVENPGKGFAGLASPNWFLTADGRRFIIYGTIRPASLLAWDVTNPAAPSLAWSYAPPGATGNAPGDVSVAVDQTLGIVLTNVFTNTGTSAPVYDLKMYGIDAETGVELWSSFAGVGPNLPGFKGGVPMVDTVSHHLYVANPLDGSYQSYDVLTGALRWKTYVTPIGETTHTPRAAGVFYYSAYYAKDVVILAEGHDIHTFDSATGTILNTFQSPGDFAVWGINQPAIVGEQMYIASTSGWVFAMPVDYITTDPGFTPPPVPPDALTRTWVDKETGETFEYTVLPSSEVLPQMPDYFNPAALPFKADANRFPHTWLAYAGGQEHNGYVPGGLKNVSWQAALNDWSIPLSDPARNEAIYGAETATHMTHLAFGVGSGVSPVKGILYAGSDRYTINALNALTGEPIWRFSTMAANFSQPLVTASTVVVSAGDPWMALGTTGLFRSNSPATSLGDGFQHLMGLDPLTGVEKWRFYTAGTNAMTPLYNKGNLYWVNGEGSVWAINADTGAPVEPFMDADGYPILTLDDFNAVASANIYYQASKGKPDIMVVGTAMGNVFYGIDLSNAQILWEQTLPGVELYVTGFSSVPPAVDQNSGLVISTVVVNADTTSNTASLMAFALNAKTGALVWTRMLEQGPIPYGFVGSPPVLTNAGNTYFFNPLTNRVVSLKGNSGDIRWQALVQPSLSIAGKLSWAPGVVVNTKLIVPVGPYLYTYDTRTGSELNSLHVGGSFTYNNPTVIGDTLYIGNSWGSVLAIPLGMVTGS